jgi:hypothetical protein
MINQDWSALSSRRCVHIGFHVCSPLCFSSLQWVETIRFDFLIYPA